MNGSDDDPERDLQTERELRWAEELREFAASRGWSPEETAIACGTVLSFLFIEALDIRKDAGRMSCDQYCEYAKCWERTRLSGIRSLHPQILPLELHLLETAEQAAQSNRDAS